MKRIPQAATLMIMLLGTASCELLSGPDESPSELTALPRALSADETAVIGASNAFAFDILRETAAGDASRNIVLSPLSASMALGMAMNGARGETFGGMRHALGFDGMPQDAINASYRGLIDLLLGLDANVEMRIGNSVWADTGYPFHESFMDTVRSAFHAEVATLDFGAPDAANTINDWVRRSTNNRIDEIVPSPIPHDVVMYLINAIYFKGDWKNPFNPDRTADAPFHRADGTTVTAKMMMREGGFHYTANDDVEIAELRYGRGAFVMDVILPRAERTAAELVATLDETRWQTWLAALPPEESRVHLRMPKYRIEYETTMNDALKTIGMELAFTPHVADFSGMSPTNDLFISNVKQKTFINVDEKGTEAAAATSVEIVETSMPPTMVVDRPFIVAIRERFSGAILFIGVIGEPSL